MTYQVNAVFVPVIRMLTIPKYSFVKSSFHTSTGLDLRSG